MLMLLLLLSGDIERCPGPTEINDYCSSRGFKVVHQIVRGLLSNLPHLETFMNMTESKVDVFAVSETHIKEGDYSDNAALYIQYLGIYS